MSDDNLHGLRDRVAVRYARIVLHSTGYLPRTTLINAGVSAAVLFDLAIAGRLQDGDRTIQIDTTPTGFEAEDRMLTCIAEDPGRTVEGWLRRAPVTLHSLAHQILRTGMWKRTGLRHEVTDLTPGEVIADIRKLHRQHAQDAYSQPAALLAHLAYVTKLPNVDASCPSTRHYQPVAWIADPVLDYLECLSHVPYLAAPTTPPPL